MKITRKPAQPKDLERANYIIKSIDNGDYSTRELSAELGITHQRVSQIYKRITGQTIDERVRRKRSAERKARREQEELTKIRYICDHCQKPVNRLDHRYGQKYCAACRLLQTVGQRALNVSLNCENCGDQFHPYRGVTKTAKYCSKKCYREAKKGFKHSPETLLKMSESQRRRFI